MKVLFLIPGLGIGGAEKNSVFLANSFIEKGIDVSISIFNGQKDLLSDLSPKVKVFEYRTLKLRNSIIPIIKIINIYSPDVVIGNMWPMTFYCFISYLFSFKKFKLIMVEHIFLSLGLKDSFLLEKIIARLVHLIFRFTKIRFIAVSDGVKEDLTNYYKLNEKQIVVISNPVINGLPDYINLNNFNIDFKKTYVRILSVGNLKPQKDYPTLLHSLVILKKIGVNFLCTIIGEGGERNKIEHLIVKMDLVENVRLLGSVKNLSYYYTNCDIFVMSSSYEGFGNVLVEALSFGCRIVSTDCNSGPSFILDNGKYGKLAKTSNPDNLAITILESLNLTINTDLIRERSKLFDINCISNLYINEIRG